MEINAQINTFVGGMNLDADNTIIDKSQYKYAENIRILTDDNGTTGVLQNIEKNKTYDFSFKEYEYILGTAVTKWFNKELGIAEDVAVIITAEYDRNGKYTHNAIYVIRGFDDVLEQKQMIKAYLNITTKVKIIADYQSQLASNIYFTDGKSLIKLINLQEEYGEDMHGEKEFDIIPNAILEPFEFKEFCVGNLPAGQVQYAYKLFNKYGVETALSPLSKKIPLSKHITKSSSKDRKGQRITENTELGCVIEAKFAALNQYDYVRIYRFHYAQNNQLPEVTIVDEVALNDAKSFRYSDIGAQPMSVMSSTEVNDLIPFTFKVQALEKMQNRLFAANIQEDTWDIEYDARAYRCDNLGGVELQSSVATRVIRGKLNPNGLITDTDGKEIVVPEDHDCINPSNLDLYSLTSHKYEYGYDNHTGGTNLVKGGTGPNVSYKFVYTELVHSSENANGVVPSLGFNTDHSNKVVTYYEDGTTVSITNGNIIPNYSDATVCANFTGYRRDEVYRFGIVFYNEKMIPSPVHWIGDIKMPSAEKETDASVVFPFHCGEKSNDFNYDVELLSYALGIEFKVKRPEDQTVVGYEIVRCDRTEVDSTILTQCAVSKLMNFDDWGEKLYYVGQDLDVRPQAWLNVLQDASRTVTYPSSEYYEFTHKFYEDYYELISPEISVTKEAFLNSLENSKLCGLYWLNASIPNKSHFNGQSLINLLNGKQDDVDYTHAGSSVSIKDVYYVEMPDAGWAAAFKYYNPTSISSLGISSLYPDITIDDAIIGKVLPTAPMTISNAKAHLQLIGGKKYVNTSILNYRRYANHGISGIVKVDNGSSMRTELNPGSGKIQTKDWTEYLYTKIFNVKKHNIGYGGNTFSARSNSTYISCGAYANNGVSKVMCYGGDTYLGIFEFQNTTAIQYEEDVTKHPELNICTVCYIPLESSVNLDLRHDESYSKTVEGDYAQNLIQNDITVFPNVYSQETPLYQYNAAYSAQGLGLNYVSKSKYSVDDLLMTNRIVSSEPKNNNELINNWTKFKFANYLDVDSQYGPITNLKNFKNRLYYFQDSAVGIASVNERSLITDNNPGALVLGTGDILSRFDYIVDHNGSSVVNDNSIINSNFNLYWYDFDKNVICQIGESFQELSKTKNVQSYLRSIENEKRDNSVSCYDAKYNEVQFNIAKKNIVFNETLGVFTSFYTNTPDFALQFSDKLVTLNDDRFILHNQGYTSVDYTQDNVSKVRFIVNDNHLYTKVYDNQNFSADFIDSLDLIREINTSTKHQVSETVYKNNIDYREDTYRFAIPRERQIEDHVNKNKSYAGRMRGKYLICDYTFDCSDNKEFRLPYIKTTYRYSML